MIEMSEIVKVRVADENGNNGELIFASPVENIENVYMLENSTKFEKYFYGQYVTVDDSNNVTGVYIDLEERGQRGKDKTDKIRRELEEELALLKEAEELTGERVMYREKVGVIAEFVPADSNNGYNYGRVKVVFEDGTEKIDMISNVYKNIDKYNRLHS